MAKYTNQRRNVQIPLASIDEDDFNDDDEVIDDNVKSIKNHSSTFDWNFNTQPLISPQSNSNTPTTPSLILTNYMSHQHNTDVDDFATDTGFFSSTSLSSLSKHSSIIDDLDLINSNHNNNNASADKSLNSISSNYTIDFMNNHDGDDVDSDDIDEMTILKMIDDTDMSSSDADNNHNLLDQISISASLEDLVNSFDDKVRNCLKNYNENVDQIAPVQMRTLDEVIQNRPAWWTLTGNYGGILPIDWEKLSPDDQINELTSQQDETLNENDTKLKELLDSCLEIDSKAEQAPAFETAEQVLKEIDEIIMNCKSFQQTNIDSASSRCSRSSSIQSSIDYIPIILRSTFYRFSLDKLKTFSLDQLQDLCEDLESKTQKHSQELINRLAERDECEYEKELKSLFLSLLVKIQKRRKNFYKKYGQQPQMHNKYRYLTTIIPYCKDDKFFNNNQILQTLIKILKAILDDSPAVPALLTDYILKYICPANDNNDQQLSTTNVNQEKQMTDNRPKSSPNKLSSERFNDATFNVVNFLNKSAYLFVANKSKANAKTTDRFIMNNDPINENSFIF